MKQATVMLLMIGIRPGVIRALLNATAINHLGRTAEGYDDVRPLAEIIGGRTSPAEAACLHVPWLPGISNYHCDNSGNSLDLRRLQVGFERH
jgi:hypothetical protein